MLIVIPTIPSKLSLFPVAEEGIAWRALPLTVTPKRTSDSPLLTLNSQAQAACNIVLTVTRCSRATSKKEINNTAIFVIHEPEILAVSSAVSNSSHSSKVGSSSTSDVVSASGSGVGLVIPDKYPFQNFSSRVLCKQTQKRRENLKSTGKKKQTFRFVPSFDKGNIILKAQEWSRSLHFLLYHH